MSQFDQWMMLSLMLLIVVLLVACCSSLLWLFFWPGEQDVEQADALWETIEQECRRIREATHGR